MENMKVQLKETNRFGRGLFALSKFKKDEVIEEYDGPMLRYDYELWTPELEDHVIQCGVNVWRATDGLAQFINHSCDPNCGVRGRFQFVAMRDIEVGEELTYDYEMTENHPEWHMQCRCGKPICRGKISQYRNMPEEFRRRYDGYISEWLWEKTDRIFR